MLNYQEFAFHIKELICNQVGTEYDVDLKRIYKNNGIERVAIVIRFRDESVEPSIYLEDFYQEYNEGISLDEIVQRILIVYEEGKKEAPVWNGQLKDMVDKVIFRIYNYEKNEILLKESPHIRYLDDLVLVFCLVAQDNEKGIGTIRVTNQIFEQLGMSFEQLKELAFANTRRMFPAVLQKMEDVIFSIMEDNYGQQEKESNICEIDSGSGLYVLTNHQKVCGAACMVYPDLLSEISSKMDSDLLILPSSVHELIITRYDSKVNLEDMKDMVCEINHTQVAPEEVLSDNVYVYYRKENTIKAA